MITLYKISEQIQRTIARSSEREDVDKDIDIREITNVVVQVLNNVLGVQQKQETQMPGVKIPACCVTNYSLAVVKQVVGGVNQYKITLPTYPIQLAWDVGVWSVGMRNGNLYKQFIPVCSSHWQLMSGTDTWLDGQIGWTREGLDVIFSGSQPLLDSVFTVAQPMVQVQLLVSDFSQLDSRTAVLPISADMEGVVMKMVLEALHVGEVKSA